MKNNSKLQEDVQNALKWEPFLNAAEIGVTVKDGVVTLSGTVDSYSKKISAERATKNVVGVKAIAEDISIQYAGLEQKNDTEIATEIVNSWKNNWQIPSEKINVKVEDGWVKLDGTVAWNYQKEASARSINHLSGVKGVTNLITIRSESKDSIEERAVQNALERNWTIDAKNVKVEVNQNKVRLSGMVHSLYQKDEAERLAWNAPGVCSVENDLAVISAQ
jgi:osmotically-inducible protein OsmY